VRTQWGNGTEERLGRLGFYPPAWSRAERARIIGVVPAMRDSPLQRARGAVAAADTRVRFASDLGARARRLVRGPQWSAARVDDYASACVTDPQGPLVGAP
jgi:hypothetical protein